MHKGNEAKYSEYVVVDAFYATVSS
jgi:hypothetical protein